MNDEHLTKIHLTPSRGLEERHEKFYKRDRLGHYRRVEFASWSWELRTDPTIVLFGHDEANQKVLEILRKRYAALDRVIQEERLVILRRESSASETLAKIEAAFAAAMAKGAWQFVIWEILGWARHRSGLPRRLTHVQQQESCVAAADKTGIKIARSHV